MSDCGEPAGQRTADLAGANDADFHVSSWIDASALGSGREPLTQSNPCWPDTGHRLGYVSAMLAPDRRRHLSFRHTTRAMFAHGVPLLLMVLLALGLGMAIYHWGAGLPWTDAFLNAAMILGGMGPVNDLTRASAATKWLAGVYALFSGLVFLVIAGAMLGPLVHAMLHHFHVESPQTKRAHESK